MRFQPVSLGVELAGHFLKVWRDIRGEMCKCPQLLRGIAEKPYLVNHNAKWNRRGNSLVSRFTQLYELSSG